MLKKHLFQICALTVAPFVFSADGNKSDVNKNLDSSSMSSMDSKNKSSQQMTSYEQAQSETITPSAGPIVKGGSDLFVDLDFIYWSAKQDNQFFAFNTNPPLRANESNQAFPVGGQIFTNGKYSPGFKVGLGAITGHDGWDLSLQYTWFRTKQKSSIYSGWRRVSPYLLNSLGFSGVTPFVVPTESFRVASAVWKLDFNDFKFELGRNYYISQKLQLRHHFGLRGGWQVQRYNTKWLLSSPSGFPTGLDWTNAQSLSENKTYFWDIGLRSGLDTSWMFTKNWAIFGNAALSTLWSEFTYTRQDFATTSGSTDSANNLENFQTFNSENVSKQITPVIELALGFRFDWWFCNDDCRLRFQAGWENQIWFNTGKLAQASEPFIRTGNLSLQGLTAKLRFDF